MGIKRRIKNKLVSMISSVKNENEIISMGEIVLGTKMLLWDTDRLPFTPENWDEYGFKVFSQNNEDGLLQYIIHHTELPQKNFIEFGVEDYSECNTRFLCWHNGWEGLAMDGSKEWMDAVKKQDIFWKRRIETKGVFITKENINDLISESGFAGNIGLLSVDIDGNDYWVLDAIECIDPQVLICEYNPIFGMKEKVSIPYKSDFYRTNAHYSNLYWGASLGAFCHLTKKRGYKLVCINSIGNNAFFVKENASDLPEVTIERAWREPLYRESRNPNGDLSFLSMREGRILLSDLPVVDVVSKKQKSISDLII